MWRTHVSDTTPQEVADKLLAGAFPRASPDVVALSDPIADTPMVVTLDQLRAYDLNPRLTRNPRHEDIKASIRERGLDAPPPITRRPGAEHYIIRNGGNTRLAILRELWTETKEERFFRITCLFRPWSSRGEIVALTGHLAENELHGDLSFIERALGIEKARELYETETGKPISQRELSRRLLGDGYPVSHSLISRMQDAVHYLLPAIPSVLYAGLGRPQTERLIALRKAAARCWERHTMTKALPVDFSTFFHEVLELFDEAPAMFHVQRVQDELVARLSSLLGVKYDALAVEFVDVEAPDGTSAQHTTSDQESSAPEQAHSTPPVQVRSEPGQAQSAKAAGTATTARSVTPSAPPQQQAPSVQAPTAPQSEPPPNSATVPQGPVAELHSARIEPAERPHEVASDATASQAIPADRLGAHIVSPAETTDRLQAIRRTIAQATGETVPDFEANVVRAIPVQAGGLHPISDVWYVEAALEAPDRLRTHIGQLAIEIAQEAGLADSIESTQEGIGFLCMPRPSGEPANSRFGRSVLALLQGLSAPYVQRHRSAVDGVRLIDDIGPLLQGTTPARHGALKSDRLSDAGVVKLFRLIRLARRLLELEWSSAAQGR
jgi:ParB family protein of integrating conjugative element (PFGI_1 class)